MPQSAPSTSQEYWRPADPATARIARPILAEGSCPDCGVEYSPGARFCHICGNERNRRPAVAPAPMTFADFFDVAKFPLASFDSTSAVPTGGRTGRLTGTFTLHGITRPITLNVTLQTPDLNADRLNFSAGMTLKRSDYGMNNYMGIIGDDVTLTIEAEFDRVR